MSPMLQISFSMWVLFFISISILVLYSYLMFRENRKLLKRLLAATGPKEWLVAVYLTFGFALVTTFVHIVPSVPDPSISSPFEDGVEAFMFGLSWSILIFLSTITYGIFKNSQYPELYLLGLLIFTGALSLAFYPLIHSDYGSQFIQGLIGVGILAILSVDRLMLGQYMYRFLWSISHIVLIGFTLWFIITGTAAYFRFEPNPGKALLYTGYVLLGAVWLYFEGIITSGRKSQNHLLSPTGFPNNELHQTKEDFSKETLVNLMSSEIDKMPVSMPVHEKAAPPSPPITTEEPDHISTIPEQIPLLRLYCLGPFRFVRGDETIDAKVIKAYQKPLEILKVIAVSTNREVSREEILDYLWETSEGDRAMAAFQKALGRLRVLLDCPGLKENKESYVIAQGGRYALHPHCTWVDIEEFLKYVNLGKRYREDGLDDNAISAFQKADELWQGHLLEGHAPKPWLIPQRKRMEETYTNLHIEAAKLLLRKKDYALAEACVLKSLAMNPDSEEGVRIIALAQYAQGKKSEALKSLNDFTGRMEKKFKTESSPKTQKLKTLIRIDKQINPLEWI